MGILRVRSFWSIRARAWTVRSPITRITPEIVFPETEGWPVGAYATPFPLSEDLFLAAYTPDHLVREGSVQREAAYGIYLVDSLGGRELIYRDASMSCFSPIPIQTASTATACCRRSSKRGEGNDDGSVLREERLPIDPRPCRW